MKKSLVALAALSVISGTAIAQSSVSISGFVNGSIDMFSISNSPLRTSLGFNTKENRVVDNSSRIIFNIIEDLGGGMKALAQVDIRPLIDASARLNASCVLPAVAAQAAAGTVVAQTAASAVSCQTPSPLAGGNSHIGLSGAAGTLRLGRQDIHYVEGGNFAPAGSATIQSHAGLLVTAAAGAAVGRASRSANLVWYTTPTINNLTGIFGVSTGSTSGSGNVDVENDLASGQRSGGTTYFRLGYAAGPITAAVSSINEKSDYIGTPSNATIAGAAGALVAAAAAQADRKGTIISAKYNFGAVKLGIASAQNSSNAYSAGVMGAASKRSNMQYGVGVPMGPTNLAITYTTVGSVKVNGVESVNTGGTALALAVSYDLSKRTQFVTGYQMLTNKASAAHSLFYNADNVVGSIGSGAQAGEKHTVLSLGLRHNF